MNIYLGDGIASLIQMALPFVKSVAPKVLGTLGLPSLGTIASSAINKKINKMNVFDKKITLNQKGSGIFSFLLPMLASTIIPALIPKKRGSGIPNKNNFF